jgi:hypothetical protein
MKEAAERADVRPSRFVKKVSALLSEVGFQHEMEAPPVRDIGKILAIDIACKDCKIAVECDGENRYLKDISTGSVTRMETGATKAKRWFLERQGWTVINVDYRDWIKACQNYDEECFLRRLLADAGVPLQG